MKGLKLQPDIADLIVGFLEGRLSAKELEKLERWVEENEEHRQLWKQLTNAAYLEAQLQHWRETVPGHFKIPVQEGSPKREYTGKSRIRNALKYAAVIVAALGMAWGTRYLLQYPIKQPADNTQIIKKDSIMPLGKVARLVLGNGETVELTDNIGEILLEEGGVQVHNGKSMLHYVAQSGGGAKEVVFNTLLVPRGGEYQLTLSDGTKVWLNAGSSLRYPAQFPDDERRVVLSGEGYFEVAHDKKRPFSIEAGKARVRVLGTKFNFNAYPDDPTENIALAEGSVMVEQNGAEKEPTFLKPGYGAAVPGDKGSIRVHKVNLEAALAWKNGMFIFDNESLGSIMKKLSRWYDVSINYESGVDTLFHFTGRIQKYENITGILQLIELTGKVKFAVEGREVKVELHR